MPGLEDVGEPGLITIEGEDLYITPVFTNHIWTVSPDDEVHVSQLKTLIGVAGKSAGLKSVHPHMLRHSCGYYLANTGVDLRIMQDYLGHRDPKHTVHYTRVAGRRFEGLWK